MTQDGQTTGTFLAIGIAILGALLLSAMAILLIGRALLRMAHGRGLAQSPPAPGSIPADRHSHISVSAAR